MRPVSIGNSSLDILDDILRLLEVNLITLALAHGKLE